MKRLAIALVLLTGCFSSQRNDSVSLSNEGAKAYGSKSWDAAIEKFTKATEKWRDNHQAFYGLAASHAQKKEWKKAADAAAKAVELEPDIAMYNLYYGWYLYEEAKYEAKDFQAKKEGKKMEDVEVDWTKVSFEKAMTYLQAAVKLNGELWRGYYLIGEIQKHAGKTKEAAESYTKSLELGAFDAAPWIALAELYRAWDYSDESRRVAENGLLVVPGAHEKSDLYYEVGMAYDSMRNYTKAIENYEKALDAKRDNHLAKFQRGQAYFNTKEYQKAKRDLEEFQKSGSSSLEFFKQQASRMMQEILQKSASSSGGGGNPAEKMSPQDVVDQAKKKTK
jgi:tetratricopeptide (TPR) repeat protein